MFKRIKDNIKFPYTYKYIYFASNKCNIARVYIAAYMILILDWFTENICTKNSNI